jgi:hypothetical protein
MKKCNLKFKSLRAITRALQRLPQNEAPLTPELSQEAAFKRQRILSFALHFCALHFEFLT